MEILGPEVHLWGKLLLTTVVTVYVHGPIPDTYLKREERKEAENTTKDTDYINEGMFDDDVNENDTSVRSFIKFWFCGTWSFEPLCTFYTSMMKIDRFGVILYKCSTKPQNLNSLSTFIGCNSFGKQLCHKNITSVKVNILQFISFSGK